VWPGRAADHSPTSSAAVMEGYSYTCTHTLGHTGPVTGKLYLYFNTVSKLKATLYPSAPSSWITGTAQSLLTLDADD